MRLFNRIHYHKKDAYWLRFLQMPKERSSKDLVVDGYSEQKVQEFWKLASFLQHLLKALAVMGAITMSLACASYLYASKQKYFDLHEPAIFWTIAISNYCSLLFIGIFDFTSTFGLILYLYLISRFLTERFDLVQTEFYELAYAGGKLDTNALDRFIHRFERIIDDLQRADHFWCKFNSLNYHFGMALCSVLLLVCKLSSSEAPQKRLIRRKVAKVASSFCGRRCLPG